MQQLQVEEKDLLTQSQKKYKNEKLDFKKKNLVSQTNKEILIKLRDKKIKEQNQKKKQQEENQIFKNNLRKKILDEIANKKLKEKLQNNQQQIPNQQKNKLESLPNRVLHKTKQAEIQEKFIIKNKQSTILNTVSQSKNRFKNSLDLKQKINDELSLTYIQNKIKKKQIKQRSQSKIKIEQKHKQYIQKILMKKELEYQKQRQKKQRKAQLKIKLRDFVLNNNKYIFEQYYNQGNNKKSNQNKVQIIQNQLDIQTQSEKPLKKRKMKAYNFITNLKEWKKKNRIDDSVKVFIITGGYGDLKKALRSRDWVQNPDPFSPCFDMKWSLQSKQIQFKELQDFQIVNHFQKNYVITTKIGLCKCLKKLFWINQVNPLTFYPRCYNLNDQNDYKIFQQEFKIGKVIAILTKYRRLINQKPQKAKPLKEKALKALEVLQRKMIDIDDYIDSKKFPQIIAQKQWNLLTYGQLTSQGLAQRKHIKWLKNIRGKMEKKSRKKKKNQALQQIQEKIIIDQLLVKIQNALNKYSENINNQFCLYGQHNIWILKPAGLSRGRGITVLNTLPEIQDHMKSKQCQWVIQKYIENPLIINNRKFDIRVLVLVTDFNPLTIWVHKSCYIRFCSLQYKATQLPNKYVHLTNNSINIKNQQSTFKSSMWFKQQFIEYLKQLEGEDIYTNKIQKQIKKSIQYSLESAIEEIENRKNSHQLYGYDFMIDDLYNVWLIQINSSPSMQYSTHVTTKVVKQILEDLVKVIIDYNLESKKKRKHIDKGNFELIFKGQQIVQKQFNTVGLNLILEGVGIKKKKNNIPITNIYYSKNK